MSYKDKIRHAMFKFSTAPIMRELMTKCEQHIAAEKSNPEKYAPVQNLMQDFQKTYFALLRLHGRESAAILAEILALIGMAATWQINKEFYYEIDTYVYSFMIAGGLYIAYVGDQLDKQQELLRRQIKTIDKATTR